MSEAELVSSLALPLEPLRLICRELQREGRLEARGRVLVRGGRAPEKGLSPMARQLHGRVVEAGSRGVEVQKLGIRGADKELRSLVRLGMAVGLEGGIYISMEIYDRLCRSILRGLEGGDEFAISHAKEATSLSRKYVIPLLNRMETDGLVKRRGDLRVVIPSGARSGGRGVDMSEADI